MRVVCFDLGGVLVEINHHWKGAMLDAGLPEELAANYDFPLPRFEAFNDYQKGRLSFEDYLAKLAEYLGGVTVEQAKETHNCILRTSNPGIPELIDEIHAAGLKTGCLSNTNAPHWEAMQTAPRLAVVQKLDFPIASHLVGAEKPDFHMYHAFEAESGALPEQIIYFDDGLENVQAALELGWHAHLVDAHRDPAGQIRRILKALHWL